MPLWREGDFSGSKKGEKKLTLIYGRHFAGVANPAQLPAGMEKQFRKELKKKQQGGGVKEEQKE